MFPKLIRFGILPGVALAFCLLPGSSAHAYPWGGDLFPQFLDLPLDDFPGPSEVDRSEYSFLYQNGIAMQSLGLSGWMDAPATSGLASPPDDGSNLPFAANSFFDVFVDINLDGNWYYANGVGEMSISVNTDLLPLDTFFDTEMLQLDISGGNLPAGTMIRESPTQSSTGQYEIQDMGGGNFHVRSFFDIFTEISVDGGASWSPANSAAIMGSQTPEPSTFVLLGLGSVMLIAVRRRRAALV